MRDKHNVYNWKTLSSFLLADDIDDEAQRQLGKVLIFHMICYCWRIFLKHYAR